MSLLRRKGSRQRNQLFGAPDNVDDDDNDESNENQMNGGGLLRQGSSHSNASNRSSGPPKPKMSGWFKSDRLSGASDNVTQEEVQSFNGDDVETVPAGTINAWGEERNSGGKAKGAKVKKGSKQVQPENGAIDQGVNAVEMTPARYRKIHDKYWGAFHNLGMEDDENADGDASAIEQIFLGIINNIKNTEDTLYDWKHQRNQIRENCRSVHEQIDSRKKEVQDMVDKYAQSLHDKVSALAEGRLDQANSNISGLKDTMKDMQKVAEKNFKEEKIRSMGPAMTKTKLEKLCAKFDHHNNQPLPWDTIVLEQAEQSQQLVGAFFGTLSGGNTDKLMTGGLDNDSRRTTGIGNVVEEPQTTGTFCCKTHKDARECGVTDVAINADNDIVVVDKHNKLVKMFDSNGVFQGFIGRKVIKDPARISILSTCQQVLVTDMSSKSIKIFNREGKYLGDFASDLKYPVCHCEMYDGNVAILEYATKSVIVYDPSLRQLHSFDTDMECPAYMACTKSNHFVVTDWRSHTVRMFDTIGTEIVTIKGKSSEEGQFDAPQGVCADRFGNVIITEKGNRRVQVFTEDGQFVRTFDTEACGFKIPWALACNKYDLLVVAEYQGYVKLLKYLDIPYDAIMSEDYQNSKIRGSKRKLVKSRHEDISETKC